MVIEFIKSRDVSGPTGSALPDLTSLATFVQSSFLSLPADTHFAVIDLVRVAFADPRVSGFFAEEQDHKTLMTLLSRVDDLSNCPYNQQLVMTQLTCNLFTSPLYPEQIISHDKLRETCIKLATTSLHDSHSSLRAAATSLVYNLGLFNHNERLQERSDKLPECDQVEVVASLLEAIRTETESVENLHGLLLSLGLLVHCVPVDGEVAELCRAMEAVGIVAEKSKIKTLAGEPLLKEVGQELLGKGLVRP
jgi:hypothetical protein